MEHNRVFRRVEKSMHSWPRARSPCIIGSLPVRALLLTVEEKTMLLKDKIAVITGGGRGLGRVIALAYAKEGADLVLASRSVEALQETRAKVEDLGRKALVVPTDIRHEASVQNRAEKALEHFGRVGSLVNNSGITGPTTPLCNITLAEWEETFAVNVTDAFLSHRAVLHS